MKKTIQFAIVLMLALCLCALAAGAAFLPVPENCTNLLFDEAEWPEILDAMGDSSLLQLEPNDYTQSILNAPAWKVYTLLSQDFGAGLGSNAPLAELISEKYVWDVQRPDSLVRLSQKDGVWTPIGSTSSNSGDVVDLDAVGAHLTALAQDDPDAALLVQCFRAPVCHTTFVLIAHGTAEYLVPFCARPEFTGLQNGALYSRQEVLQTLEPYFSAAFSGNYNGGSGDTASAFPWVPCVVIAAAAVLFVIVFLRAKKSKRSVRRPPCGPSGKRALRMAHRGRRAPHEAAPHHMANQPAAIQNFGWLPFFFLTSPRTYIYNKYLSVLTKSARS